MRLVLASHSSLPTMTLNMVAASDTLLAIGPTVSCSSDIGMTEARETKPVVVLMPTTLFLPAGLMMLPDV